MIRPVAALAGPVSIASDQAFMVFGHIAGELLKLDFVFVRGGEE